MERGQPLRRRAPLDRGGPLQRSTPPRRGRPAGTGPTRAQRGDLLDRHARRCVICGVRLLCEEQPDGVPYSDHHRTGRGMGGRQGAARAVSNLPGRRLPLCGDGVQKCHGWVTNPPAAVGRAHVEALGWVVRRSHPDPQLVLVWSWRGWLRCLDDGTVEVLDRAAPLPPPKPWRPA